VKVLFGTDAGCAPWTEVTRPRSSGTWSATGCLRSTRFAAPTSLAADFLRIDAGALEAGRLADIVAVAGDPLADPSVLGTIDFVMKGGSAHRLPGDDGRVLAGK